MDEEIFEIIEGKFIRTIYKSDNYMVSKFDTDEGPITVTGPSFEYDNNQKYILSGSFVDHPKYGFQFNIKTIDKYIPTKKDEIVNFLSSKSFKGVGKKAANKIYEYFGDDTINILKNDISLINQVSLTSKQILGIEEGFVSLTDPQNETIFFLISNGFSNNEALKIFNKFKFETIQISNDNPFRFYNEIYGMNFNSVKDFASRIDFSDKEEKYKVAYLINYIKEYTFNTGDIYIELDILKAHLMKYNPISNFNEILQDAIDSNYLVLDDNRIYLYDDYNDEKYIAEYLTNFNGDNHLDDILIEEGIDLDEKEFNIKYDVLQKQAISNFFKNDISIIVGGPGTGKTTIVKAMVNMYKKYLPYNSLVVVAPTGRAAKRINEVCEVEAKTIHSLLRWNLETNTFVFNIDNPILYDAIIIDEFSMVDNNLFANLLKACKNIKKICIIGDDNQLPSIKPGYVLNDLIESNRFITTYLTVNFRQSSLSDIVNLSQDIINDTVNFETYNSDIIFLDTNKDKFDIVDMIDSDIQEGYSLDEIQVLAPMYKGQWGIDNLNVLLQDAFNSSDDDKNEKQFGSVIYREQDKILQLKNRPMDDVYNGDIGTLEEIDYKDKCLLVNYNGIYCFYSFEDLSEISLAYAMSVHKAQGSEYQIVYFILTRQNMRMLNKKLIYTAISRAKKKLVIISEKNVFHDGIANMLRKRNTTLINRLK